MKRLRSFHRSKSFYSIEYVRSGDGGSENNIGMTIQLKLTLCESSINNNNQFDRNNYYWIK